MQQETSIVFHNNGETVLPYFNKGPSYAKIIEEHLFGDVEKQFCKPPNLDIVLCHNYSEAPLAERCLNHYGIRGFHVLGQHISKFRQFHKVPLVLEFLKTKSAAEYVLYLDAKDVLVCGDPTILLERFVWEFSCDILFNAEKGSYPSSIFGLSTSDTPKVSAIEHFEKATYRGPFLHLNSGCYIGRRGALIELLEEAMAMEGYLESFPNDDQGIFRELHRKYYPRVQIDHACRIFQSLYLVNETEVKYPCPIKPWRLYTERLKQITRNVIRRPAIHHLLLQHIRFVYHQWREGPK